MGNPQRDYGYVVSCMRADLLVSRQVYRGDRQLERDMAVENAEIEVKSLMSRYIDLFNADDFATAVDECYNLPFSWLVGSAIDSVTTKQAFVERMSVMRAALAEQGFERSDLVGCTVRMLGANAALAGVEVARHYADNRPIEVTGGTYVAHNDGSKWKLTSLIGHPVSDIVSSAP